MSSAILYAASAGVEVGVYGDPMALESDHAVLGGVGKPRRIWPEMHQFSVPMDYAAEVANRELGADEMLLPAEVIDAFGWAPEIAQPGPPPPRRPSRTSLRSSRAVVVASTAPRAIAPPATATPRDQQISVDASVDDTDELADDHGPQAGSRGAEARARPRAEAAPATAAGGRPRGHEARPRPPTRPMTRPWRPRTTATSARVLASRRRRAPEPHVRFGALRHRRRSDEVP